VGACSFDRDRWSSEDQAEPHWDGPEALRILIALLASVGATVYLSAGIPDVTAILYIHGLAPNIDAGHSAVANMQFRRNFANKIADLKNDKVIRPLHGIQLRRGHYLGRPFAAF
jgi:hypothetical protein